MEGLGISSGTAIIILIALYFVIKWSVKNGIKEAFFYIEELVREKISLSENIIKDIHSIVLMDKPQDRRKYRRMPVTILGAVHEPPQPYLVPVLMERLINEYNEDMSDKHIIERVALFHLQFEAIHPFIDGSENYIIY